MLRYLSTRVQELFETEESRRERRAIWEQYCASWAEEPCFLCNDLDPTKKDLKFYTLKDLNSSQANKGCPGCAILIEGVQRSLSKWAYQKESDILDAHGDRSPKLNWNYSESSTLHMSVRYFSSSPIDLDLEYFVPAGSVLGSEILLSNSKVIPRRSDSPQCFEQIRSWIDNCLQLHKKCSKPETSGTLPKRVLDVGVIPGSNIISLYESQHEAVPYIALSHCWGNPTIHKIPLKTLKSNINEMKNNISWDLLSKTFQQAITTTQQLGIRFLWIDSLCIIQDDGGDWEEQAALMGAIYEHAYLTISATSGASGADGCYFERDQPEKLDSGVHVQRRIDHAWYGNQSKAYPTASRGWCLQERILSTRILHYTKAEMIWECRDSMDCECGDLTGGSTRPQTDGRDWHKIVELYSKADLTKSSDKLPAISAMASAKASQDGSLYLAGLWVNEFPLNLGWHCPETGRRPESFTAPSFSWASVMGGVATEELMRKGVQATACASLVNWDCVHKGLDRFGAVSSGYIVIRGILLDCTFQPGNSTSPRINMRNYDNDREWGKIHWDTKGEEELAMERHICLLPLLYYHSAMKKKDVRALALVKAGDGIYQRAGFAEYQTYFEYWSIEGDEVELCII